jgi:protein SCO1/2
MRIIRTMFFAFVAVSAVSGGSGNDKRTPQAAADPYNYTDYNRRALQSHFPDVVLLTQDNQRVRFYSDLIRDKTVVIQFFFTRCEALCPMTTPTLARVHHDLNKRAAGKVTFLSITVDPDHDDPAVLRRYSSSFRPETCWYFLTGKKNDVDLIRKQLGVYDPDEKKAQHMNVLTIGKEPSAVWMSMEALAKPDDIARTILRVLAWPATGKP